MVKKSLGKEVFSNISFHFFASMFNRVGGLIFTVLIARILVPESFGVYALALSILLFALTIADLGFNQTVIRYVAEALGDKNKAKARTCFQFLGKMRLGVSLIFSVLLFLTSSPIAIYIFKNADLILPLQVGSLYFLLATTSDFLAFTFFGVKSTKHFSIKELFFQTFKIIFGVSLAFFLITPFKVAGIFAALALASLIALVVAWHLLKKYFGFLFKGKTVKIDKKRILRYSLFLIMGLKPVVVFTYIDSLMLGAFVPVEYVGFYRAALTIPTSLAALLAFHLVMFPFLTQAKGKDFNDLFVKIFHFTSLIAIPCVFGLALIGAPLIKLFYGINYLPAAMPLYILAFVILDVTLFTYFARAFQAKEMPEIPVKVVAIAAVINVILNYILITTFAAIRVDLGMVGAAIATVISRYFYGITLGISAKKILNIAPKAASIYKPIIASIIMAAFLLAFNRLFGLMFPLAIIEIILAIIIYFVALYLIKGITMKEITYLKNIVWSYLSKARKRNNKDFKPKKSFKYQRKK